MDDLDPSDQYFRDRFNTTLTPEEEGQFVKWAVDNNRLGDLTDYDLRGFWKAKESFGDNGHGTDKYKKPNHPTFSDQSVYHGHPMEGGGVYEGGTWREADGRTSYTPSRTMLQRTHDPRFLTDYFKKYEPDVDLTFPPEKPTDYTTGP